MYGCAIQTLCERLSVSHFVALALFSDSVDLLLRCLLFLKVSYGDMSSVEKMQHAYFI